MRSESELRSRIDELTTSINAQKHILRALETQRSNARSKLNSIRDPMARLPVEISAEIFLHCVPTDPLEPDPAAAPIVLLNVSHLWRDIAVSTPALWSHIRTTARPLSSEFVEFCRIWIGRARSLPLSFAFHGRLKQRARILVTEYGQRLQTLELVIRDGADLERLEGPFPALKALTICSDETYSISTPKESVEILRAAPQLVHCDFDEVFYDWGIHDGSFGWQAGPLIHTALRHLRLGKSQSSGNSAYILQYLTLPALKSLRMTDFDINSDDLIAFLTRSAPPLESLSMITPTNPGSLPTFLEYFRLTPSLTDLELSRQPNYQPGHDSLAPFRLFWAALGTQDFLANLRRLTLWICFPRAADYEALLFALRGRRAHLESFQLIFPIYSNEVEEPPDGDSIAAFKQLAQDGMHIHVGPRDGNLV
ncbi:hypothetical protein DFH06DRAFT_1208884 [Mycena polygramma]|nr:hypothetical protein DFH06DRAFT_1208884 [Mycena polygramma]